MKLTDEQKTALNVGLATWEGWTKCDPAKFESNDLWHLKGSGFCLEKDLPNYCFDLNAIYRLEERLTDEEHKLYRDHLFIICDGDYRAYISASASQRAIALARALNLNIEGVTQ